MRKRVELKIYGEVQGVFYRARACDIAKNFNLVGWVRNESDGSVKIIAEGDEDALKCLIKKCYTIPNARVEKIDAEWQEVMGEFEGFNIIY